MGAGGEADYLQAYVWKCADLQRVSVQDVHAYWQDTMAVTYQKDSSQNWPHGDKAAMARIIPSDFLLSELTIPALKIKCRLHGLKVTGNKPDFLKRLRIHRDLMNLNAIPPWHELQQMQEQARARRAGMSSSRCRNRRALGVPA